MVTDREGKAILLPFSRWAGKIDLTFEPQKRKIIATTRVKVILKDWVQVDPSDRQTVIKDPTTGRPISWPYSSDQAESLRRGLLHLKEVERQGTPDLTALQSKIDEGLGAERYFLEPEGCSAGSVCACRIPIELQVKLDTEQADPHFTINLFPSATRADAKNVGEINVVPNDNLDPGAPMWLPLTGPDHVAAHEAGHWLGWPDEYFVGGGAVHRRYIGKDMLVDVQMDQPNDDWKRHSHATLMGSGVYSADPIIPSYYMHIIRDWFNKESGLSWKVSA